MNTTDEITIAWSGYRPSPDMRAAIASFNQRSLAELLEELPAVASHRGSRVTFSYRLYSDYALNKVEKVYVVVSGFAERTDIVDAGVKGLLTDLLAKRVETRKYALVVVGGLFSFPMGERNKLLKRGSGALLVTAEEIADWLKQKFPALQTITASGYSMGGVMAPLIAQAVIKQGVATVDQVCSGEPTYVGQPTSGLHLLKRTTRASAYRNEQIKATSMDSYIAVKKTPGSGLAVAAYRARLYRPLFWELPSMRLVVRDLALQSLDYPQASSSVQLQEALRYLASQGVIINLLHAEHSILCQGSAFYQLVDDLRSIDGVKLRLIVIRGPEADHGIEEQRSLSTPFLIMPEMYQSSSL